MVAQGMQVPPVTSKQQDISISDGRLSPKAGAQWDPRALMVSRMAPASSSERQESPRPSSRLRQLAQGQVQQGKEGGDVQTQGLTRWRSCPMEKLDTDWVWDIIVDEACSPGPRVRGPAAVPRGASNLTPIPEMDEACACTPPCQDGRGRAPTFHHRLSHLHLEMHPKAFPRKTPCVCPPTRLLITIPEAEEGDRARRVICSPFSRKQFLADAVFPQEGQLAAPMSPRSALAVIKEEH